MSKYHASASVQRGVIPFQSPGLGLRLWFQATRRAQRGVFIGVMYVGVHWAACVRGSCVRGERVGLNRFAGIACSLARFRDVCSAVLCVYL
jgi:hypothetical protein